MERADKSIKIILLVIFGLIQLELHAQSDSLVPKKDKIKISGYIKDLQNLSFFRNSEQIIDGNLIHNRINLKYGRAVGLSSALEMRNRIFWGELLQQTPGFSIALKDQNELLDLSILWIDRPDLVMHTNIDRFWLQYRSERLEMRIGRQRINWGISTLWNPNDIFNTYDFLDFDYEERPGRDAIKLNYQWGEMSYLELAATSSKALKNKVIAIKYFFNEQFYDYQFIAGYFKNTMTIGVGWSGSIGNIGFKGESQYYFKHQSTNSLLNLTLEMDYLFENSWYIGGGFLYNSMGYNKPLTDWSAISFDLSPQYLMPTKWNTTFSLRKQFTPLFNGSLTGIYSPGTNLVILLPALSYNMATNFDLDLVFQSFFAEEQKSFNGLSHTVFLRTKWSF
ncbi:hypothetical protein [Gaetbulibacter aestuarii]|uniref:Alginate export domain-containing protein n=1 Tax=Gaetbulibacter aestuarii TaxID=1502358 RepID=A0ABW7MZL7_9FLAO